MVKKILYIAIIFLLCTNLIKAQNTVIHLQANNNINNKDLSEAIAQAHDMGANPVILNLELGTYYFSRSESIKELYYVSNTTSETENPDPTKHIALLLKGSKNVTIDGNGSTLMMTGEMTSFVIDSCENITFRNLNFDYAHPTQTEIEIIEKGDKHLIARVHPTSQYRITNHRLEWYGDGWSFSGGIAQAYNREKDITWRTWSPMTDLLKTTELENNKLRMEYSKTPEASVGQIYQMRDAIRDEVCGFIHKSKNVHFENCNFYYLGNFGIVGQYSENITFKGVNFEPEKDSGRTNAGFADFLQISGCRGLIEVDNCRFAGAHDDPINIHGTHLQVKEFVDANKIKVRFMHHQSYGFEAFFEGDKIEFIDNRSLLAVESATIKKVEAINPREIILTLSKKLPLNRLDAESLVIENVTWIPDVKITNSSFSRIPSRGILVTTRGKVLIENNTFNRMQMSAILVADDVLSWYESGMAKDVTIRNNQFIECGAPVINIAPENKIHKGAVHKNIKIENNVFKLKSPQDVAIQAKSVDGLHIVNNLFSNSSKTETKAEQLIQTTDCTNVSSTNHKFE